MTSKEDFKRLRKEYYKFCLSEDFDEVGVFNNIEKDLEKLEQYETLFQKPVQELMQWLKILKIIKEKFENSPKILECKIIVINKEEAQEIEEWLENEKLN